MGCSDGINELLNTTYKSGPNTHAVLPPPRMRYENPKAIALRSEPAYC